MTTDCDDNADELDAIVIILSIDVAILVINNNDQLTCRKYMYIITKNYGKKAKPPILSK